MLEYPINFVGDTTMKRRSLALAITLLGITSFTSFNAFAT